jgi:hypothetical protein
MKARTFKKLAKLYTTFYFYAIGFLEYGHEKWLADGNEFSSEFDSSPLGVLTAIPYYCWQETRTSMDFQRWLLQ